MLRTFLRFLRDLLVLTAPVEPGQAASMEVNRISGQAAPAPARKKGP